MISILIWIGLLLIIVFGVPIAFSMGVGSIIMLLLDGKVNIVVIAQRAINGVDSYTLLAIPFFIVAAQIMSETGIGEKIFDFANSLVSPIPGGLGQVNVFDSVIHSGMSGSCVTDLTGMGKLEIDAMVKAGYDRPFSSAVSATSCLLGAIFPPSISMVLYSAATGVSLGGLLLAGIVPGVLMTLAMGVVVFIISKRRNYPTYPRAPLKELAVNFVKCIPCLLMPLILMGSILGGIMTPTEAACTAVIYAIILGTLLYRNLSFKNFFRILEKSIDLICSIMLIISAAAILGLVLTQQQIPQKMIGFFIGISNNPLVVVLIINLVLLVIGTVMETTSMFMIMGPILGALAIKLGVDPVHFGMMVVYNFNLALVTPPVGMVLFLTCKVGQITSAEFVREMWPFLGSLVVVLLLIIFIPQLSVFIPNLFLK